MDKLAKSIVKELHNNDAKKDITCAYVGSFDYLGTFTLPELADRVGASVTNTRLAINYLKEIGYIEPVYYGSTDKNKKVGGFRLSHRGNHCKEIALDELKKTLFKSVFLPCVVSFITTLATIALKELLPQILQWITHIL